MIEHLATAGTLNAPRKHRFSEQFNDDILNMVASLTDDVTKHYRKVTNLERCGSGMFIPDPTFFHPGSATLQICILFATIM